MNKYIRYLIVNTNCPNDKIMIWSRIYNNNEIEVVNELVNSDLLSQYGIMEIHKHKPIICLDVINKKQSELLSKYIKVYE